MYNCSSSKALQLYAICYKENSLYLILIICFSF